MRHAAVDDLYDLPPGVGSVTAAASAPTAPATDYAASMVSQDGCAAPTRCWPDIDAIKTSGSRCGAHNICIQWANGACALGVHCSLRHALPTLADEQRLLHSADGLTHDIFGRPGQERPAGSLFDPLACQTLHVVGLPTEGNRHSRRRVLEAAFGEWGEVARVWLVADPRVGYVKFKWRSSAQMALEAMQGRPLTPDLTEELQLGWCASDPSMVQAQQAREMALTAMHEARERQEHQHALYQSLERGSAVHAPKRQRTTGDHGEASNASAWYEQPEEPLSAVAAVYPDTNSAPSVGTIAAQQMLSPLPEGWTECMCSIYGVPYYCHAASGCSQWERPYMASKDA